MEKDLWNIFTFATLHGNPRDPSRLSSNGLLKICRDAMLFDESMTERATTQAQVHLIFTSELKKANIDRSTVNEDTVSVGYEQFLSCLARIAEVCYPSYGSVDNAMRQLLMDNVLPFASRSSELSLQTSRVISLSEVVSLKYYYEDALRHLFDYYSSLTSNKAKLKLLTRTTNAANGLFDENTGVVESRNMSHITKELFGIGKGEDTNRTATKKFNLGYEEYLRFCNDFGLQVGIGLTSIDLGEIYLAIISKNNFVSKVRSLNFAEFWETLVCCSQRAFETYHGLGELEKVKCLFLFMWRHIQVSVGDQMKKDAVGLSTAKGELIRGAQLLNGRFIALWAKDNYRDYTDGRTSIQNLELSQSRHAQSIFTGSDGIGTSIIATGQSTTRDGSNRTFVNVDDDLLLGDERIESSELRTILIRRPDLVDLLKDCLAPALGD